MRQHLRGGPARLHVPRRRRHDRPGRGHRRRGVPRRRSRSTASSSPSSTATPAAAPRCRVKEVVGKPIAFASTGEKLDDFELFHPDRLAGRILGMGDVLTLIEKAEEVYEKDEAEEAAAAAARGQLHPRGLPRPDAAGQEDGPARGHRRDDARACPRRCKNAEIDDERDRPGRGDHPLDDRRRAAPTRAHRRLPPHAHRQRQRAPRPTEVNELVKQFKRDAEDDEAHGRLRRQDAGARAARARRARRAAGSPPSGAATIPGAPAAAGRSRRLHACPGLNCTDAASAAHHGRSASATAPSRAAGSTPVDDDRDENHTWP